MSLKIWLPLNGDLHNQGCSDIEIINNGATIDNNGKIGKCYNFNNSFLISNKSILDNNTDDWSFSCWFKPTSQHNGCLFSNRNIASSNGIAIFYYNTQIIFDDGERWQFTPSEAILINTWNHLTFVRKKEVGKFFYLNGQLRNSTTITATPTNANASVFSIGGSQESATTVTNDWLNGSLNDIRIYNHALSVVEVQEIARGLILHYKMNNVTNNTIQDSSGYNNNGILNITTTLSSDSGRYNKSIYFDNYDTPNIIFNNSTNLLSILSNCTITWWGKYDSTKTLLLTGQSSDYFIAASDNNNFYHSNIGNSFIFYKDGIQGSYKCMTDDWHFFTIKNVDLSNWTIFKINSFDNDWPLKGFINDLRIYCTPLLDKDIKLLYNTNMRIDNLGNLHTFEYIENENEKITKTGLTKTGELEEHNLQQAKLKKEQGWLSPNFIEI